MVGRTVQPYYVGQIWQRIGIHSNVECLSSHQLVFGTNPNLPNIMKDKLPALIWSTSSEIFAKHLNALHSARKAYIQSESEERIRRALRYKVRASEQVFNNGDNVFYKREGKEWWLGPGKVVFQDGKVVFVRHGSVFVRVSPNRLCKIEDNTTGRNAKVEMEKIPEDSTSEFRDGAQTKINDEISETMRCKNTDFQNVNMENGVVDPHESVQLKPKERIQYKIDSGSKEWIKATVLGRAGKVTGRIKEWYNVEKMKTRQEKVLTLVNFLGRKQTHWNK